MTNRAIIRENCKRYEEEMSEELFWGIVYAALCVGFIALFWKPGEEDER